MYAGGEGEGFRCLLMLLQSYFMDLEAQLRGRSLVHHEHGPRFDPQYLKKKKNKKNCVASDKVPQGNQPKITKSLLAESKPYSLQW